MQRTSSLRVEHRRARSLASARDDRAVRTSFLGLIAVLALALGACDDLTSLDQDAPSRIPADSLERPENAVLLVQSAIGDFECALANYVVAGGLVGDELLNSNLSNRLWDYDRRTILPINTVYSTTTCGDDPTVYTVLSIARYDADNALRLLDGWTDAEVPNRTQLIATAATYAGYSLVLLGEGMCSAAIDVGPELSPAEVLGEAEARFTRAIEAATAVGDEATLNLALLGRARARLGLDNLTGAAGDAALLPSGFRVNATYSAAKPQRENLVFTFITRDLLGTVDVPYRGVVFEDVPDPRVAVVDAGIVGADETTPMFLPAKYSAFESPIRMASWEEAQLILAEAAVAGGDVTGAVSIINTLHTNAGLPPYAGGTADEVMNQVIEERRRELFLEGHRLGDIIRYGLPLFPAVGTPFSTGAGTSGVYGTQVCFPLPAVERNNNPNIPD
jgi:starch-binding outer membrane protein, SusD/RagB family